MVANTRRTKRWDPNPTRENDTTTYFNDNALQLGMDILVDVEAVDLDIDDDHLLRGALIGVHSDEGGNVQAMQAEAAGVRAQRVGRLALLLGDHLLPAIIVVVVIIAAPEAGGDGEADAGAEQRRLGQAQRERQGAQARGVEERDAVGRQGDAAAVDDAARHGDPEHLEDVGRTRHHHTTTTTTITITTAITTTILRRCGGGGGGSSGSDGGRREGRHAAEQRLAEVPVVRGAGVVAADGVARGGGRERARERHLGRQQHRLRPRRPAPGVPARRHRALQLPHPHHRPRLARVRARPPPAHQRRRRARGRARRGRPRGPRGDHPQRWGHFFFSPPFSLPGWCIFLFSF
ncbi:putative dihydroneopterin aldolase family protein [Rosellinia necatrix]|uniref:Putative dihydroneopterin aldolase family protein n=1 Tax=Rosellinia necatrix TaxID=77044 RepID=A0A1S8A4Y9_ROSNE|nr:putative dihydroneopterin aldolase family protein [Rosellinia necatrix]